MIRTVFAVLWVMAITTGAASAAGDAKAGKTKAAICASCHGIDGNSTNPEWPSLAGQHPKYLTNQVIAFKQGTTRSNILMAPMIQAMTEQDIEDVAAFYATLPRRGMFADKNAKEVVALGERLYRAGKKETATAACMGCHGPNGAGNSLAGFPQIASQHATYTAMQLKMFRSGERSNDPQGMMRDAASKLTDDEIDALAQYLAGLR